MLLAVVGISVAANAQAGSCKISGAAYETVQAVVTNVDGNTVYFTLTTEYDKPVNAQVKVTVNIVEVNAANRKCSFDLVENGGGTAPGKGMESREYSVTFPKKVEKVHRIEVTSAACN